MSELITHRQGILSDLAACQSHDVWRVEPLVHGGALTSINDEEQLVVPADIHTINLKRNLRQNTLMV